MNEDDPPIVDEPAVEIDVTVIEAPTAEPNTVELINDAIDHIVEEVTSDEHHDDNLALLVGALTTTVGALVGRIDQMESRIETASVDASVALQVADSAVDIATDVVEEIRETVTEDVTEPEVIVEPDIAPPTRRQKLGKSWFG